VWGESGKVLEGQWKLRSGEKEKTRSINGFCVSSSSDHASRFGLAATSFDLFGGFRV
jgi:hypothetical protein